MFSHGNIEGDAQTVSSCGDVTDSCDRIFAEEIYRTDDWQRFAPAMKNTALIVLSH